ncbi:MAG: carbohydrate ABC transporter permease [Oscillospiraceae bacterium]|jgi:putative aldouronate transport system permease protein|nr:carbohydrate ABC transporter permease [Oscillospiraceae bacterium]
MAKKVSASRKTFLIANHVILIAASLLCLLPFVNLLAISFSNKIAVVAREVAFWPKGFNVDAYKFILHSNAFSTALWISVKRTALGVAVNLALIILTAYPLSKSKTEFRARQWFSWFFVITILFQAGMIPMYLVVRYTHLINSLWSLVLPGALPVFSMLVVMNYIRGLPQELMEAAYIDGAGHMRTLWSLVLPVSTPTIATVALFSLVNHWNSWYDGMIYMNKIESYPLQSYLRTVVINPEAFFRNATNMSDSLQRFVNTVNARTTNAAQLFLGMIPILLVYPFLQKYFTTGLVLGSVKG